MPCFRRAVPAAGSVAVAQRNGSRWSCSGSCSAVLLPEPSHTDGAFIHPPRREIAKVSLQPPREPVAESVHLSSLSGGAQAPLATLRGRAPAQGAGVWAAAGSWPG